MKRKNTATPLGPDTCQADGCSALVQTTLSASTKTLRQLGFNPSYGLTMGEDVLSLRVCLKCYLRGMAEALTRSSGTHVTLLSPHK